MIAASAVDHESIMNVEHACHISHEAAAGVLHRTPTWRGLAPRNGEIVAAGTWGEEGLEEGRQVHVKVIELTDSAAASSAWRELVMLLQVHLSPFSVSGIHSPI